MVIKWKQNCTFTYVLTYYLHLIGNFTCVHRVEHCIAQRYIDPKWTVIDLKASWNLLRLGKLHCSTYSLNLTSNSLAFPSLYIMRTIKLYFMDVWLRIISSGDIASLKETAVKVSSYIQPSTKCPTRYRTRNLFNS